eukprot:5881663-Pleurochrysis_carterae.AAC.3
MEVEIGGGVSACMPHDGFHASRVRGQNAGHVIDASMRDQPAVVGLVVEGNFFPREVFGPARRPQRSIANKMAKRGSTLPKHSAHTKPRKTPLAVRG